MVGPAGIRSPRTGNYYRHTQLLFPIKNKDYSKDNYISLQWKTLRDYLADNTTHRVTIFGYSAPKSDKVALAMMKEAWGNISERNLEQFEIIDIRPENEVLPSWADFIHTHHYDYCNSFYESVLARSPRRTSELFFCQYIPSSDEDFFVELNPMPERFSTFKEMWDWFQPLIDKEKEYDKN